AIQWPARRATRADAEGRERTPLLCPEAMSPDQNAKPPSYDNLEPGLEFASRYQLVRTLGQGGFGKVFLAQDLTLEIAVALQVLHIGAQICAALDAAHRVGVVHRDLKPHNVIIDREGVAKILDFGIARTVDSAGVTGTGSVMGTPTYMSPEQCRGDVGDPRS